MKNVISFSGGRTSAFMTLEVLKIHPNSEVIFMDTGAEHPKTYEFIRNFSRVFGIKITCIRVVPNAQMRKASTYEQLTVDEIGPDLTPWKRMLNKYGHPYVGGAFCTDRMKTVPFTKYCDEKYGKGNYERWLGIRIDEPARMYGEGIYKSLIREGYSPDDLAYSWRNALAIYRSAGDFFARDNLAADMGYECKHIPLIMERMGKIIEDGFHFLYEESSNTKQDILDWWSDQSFDLGIQEHLGNCVFCIKKSLQKVALASKDEPELAEEFWQMIQDEDKKEDKVMYRSNRSFGDVIALFEDISRNELASRMHSMRQYDTGSCSESCEAFGGENG